MTHISRRKLGLHTEKVLREFVRAAYSRLSNNDVYLTLNSLLSKTEIAMLEKRVGIILLLEMGYNSKEVSDVTKTTRQTVDRFKLQLKLVPQKEKNLLLRRMKTTFAKELVKDFLKKLDFSKSRFRKKITPF